MARSKSAAYFLVIALVMLVGPLVTGIYAQHVPADLDVGINLSGAWMAASEGTSNPPGDPNAWHTIDLPGGFADQNVTGLRCWLRREFDVNDNAVQGDRLLVTNFLAHPPRVWIDGVDMGTMRTPSNDMSTFSATLRVPGPLSTGKHTILLRLEWDIPDYDGQAPGLLLLAPEQPMQNFLQRYTVLYTALQFAIIGTLFLLSLTLLFMSKLTQERKDRSKHIWGAVMCVATATFAFPYSVPSWPPFIYAVPAMLALALSELIYGFEIYNDRRILWGYRCALTPFALLVVAPVAWVVSIDVAFIFATIPCLALFMVLIVRWCLRGAGLPGIAALVAAIEFTFTGISDFLCDMKLFDYPGLFIYGCASVTIFVGFTVIADFLKLYQLNRDLTFSLTDFNAKLQVALSHAQESSRVKGEFLATMSHELRTPLNAIINLPVSIAGQFATAPLASCSACDVQVTLDEGDVIGPETVCPGCSQIGTLQTMAHGMSFQGDAPEALSLLDAISRSGRHLLGIVNDILDYSKMESRGMRLHVEPLSLSDIVGDVRMTLEPLAQKAGLTLVWPEQDLKLLGDRIKLAQVLINLFGNAIKFSPSGSRVCLSATVEGGDCILSVQDQGEGLAPEHQAIIFEPFRQVDGSHTRKHGGTGLGLSIVREIVVLHGGKIWVESQLGHGATFKIQLPLQGPNPAAQAQGDFGASPSSVAPEVPQPSKTVLVLDDEPLVLEAAKTTLKPLGCAVVGITDPRQFIDVCKSLKPDLILIDIMMPHIGGDELLREYVKFGDVSRVVVASAYEGNRATIEAMGVEWVDKPWNDRLLRQLVSRKLGRAQQPQ